MTEIDTAQIAAILRVSRRHVTDRLVKRPDFPLPTLEISRKTRLWDEEAVRKWASPDGQRSPQG